MTVYDQSQRASSGQVAHDRAARAPVPATAPAPSRATPVRRPATASPSAPGAADRMTPGDILGLQETAGNEAVVALVAAAMPGQTAASIQRDAIGDEPAAPAAPGGPGGGTGGAPRADAEPRPTLHPGDGPDPDIGVLQQKLNATGAATPPLRITAMYTEATTAAVISFQVNHGIEGTGIADAATWTELDRLAPSVVRNGRVVVDAPGEPDPLGHPEGGRTHPTIRRGSRGPAVEELQQRLNNAPPDEVPTLLEVDGRFGPRTRQAVVEFQTAHPPLERDGVVGPLTWAMIDQIPGNVTVGRVEFSSDERVEGNIYGGDTRYTWRLLDDALEVTVGINFTGLTNHPQVPIWLGQIASVWNGFSFVDEADPGRRLQLRFVANRATPGDNSVRVYSAAPGTPQFRSDAGNWNVQDPDGGLAPHEFGHLIGLQDEYRLGADAYVGITGEQPLIGEVTGDAEPAVIADELWTALNLNPAAGRAAAARAVITNHSLVQGAFSQRVAEAYELAHAADLQREDFVTGVGFRIVPNPGGTIDLDIAARLPGQNDEARITNPFTYTNRSLMGNMQSLSNPQARGTVTAEHDHPVEERHVRHFLRIVQANRSGSWRLVRGG
jgi:peptidoglycan hydrolase-like protein with peptidoglycan-binding domain